MNDRPIGLTEFLPSIDVFFRSVVHHWMGKEIGILLTGMGKDDAIGLGALRSGSI
ncbi:chemotaxis protein CheB [Pantanalinema sp. GBBB05]|uniref:chemotaxis protein CheB n=1 Tax=Pantanalinema sp. GBBB05 TaxID=2604139 RepID=UPI003D8145FB